MVNPLNAKLHLICHLLALLGAHPILHISRVRVNFMTWPLYSIKKSPHYLPNRGLGRPQSWSGHFEEDKKICSPSQQ